MFDPVHEVRLFEEAGHGGTRDAGVAGDAGDVHDLSVAERRHLEEARERAQVLGQGLLLDLLAQVGADVGIEHVDRLAWCASHHREAAGGEQVVEGEVEVQFGRGQREELPRERAAGQ